jgi:hypothetical protein
MHVLSRCHARARAELRTWVARIRLLISRASLEAGTAVISSRRVGYRRVPLPYLVGDGGQRHRQRFLRRRRRRKGEEVAVTAGLVVVVVHVCRRRAVADQRAQLVDAGGGGEAPHRRRVHQTEQRVRGGERVRVPGMIERHSHRPFVLMIAECRSRSACRGQVATAGRRQLLPRRRRRLGMCRGVIRDDRRRRALAVEKVQLGRSCGRRGRGRRRRCLLLRSGRAGGRGARRGGAAVVDARALIHAAEGDFSLQIHGHA